MILTSTFFDSHATDLAINLLGKVIRHRISHEEHGDVWLTAQIVETEAYYLDERGSHSSLGFTEKRRAMFMAPGTIYMYYARGGDSLNFSARGKGNAVLIKSGIPYLDAKSSPHMLEIMHELNPVNGRRRAENRLCSGQTLLCRSLGLKVPDWDQQQLSASALVVSDCGIEVSEVIQCQRLGIPAGRDEDLPYRFVDKNHYRSATQNPMRGRFEVKRGNDC